MPPPPVEATASLAQRLRTATRVAHLEAERALDLDARLVDRHAYAALLATLHPFHAGVEARLGRVAGWAELDPAVDLAARKRASLLVRDLDALGPRTPSARGGRLPEPESLSAALGCLYVLEGSLLGGGVIARRARDRLGDVPVAFFSGSGRRVGADWHSFQRTLDSFGRSHGEAACATAVAAAHDTFAAFTVCLAREAQAA